MNRRFSGEFELFKLPRSCRSQYLFLLRHRLRQRRHNRVPRRCDCTRTPQSSRLWHALLAIRRTNTQRIPAPIRLALEADSGISAVFQLSQTYFDFAGCLAITRLAILSYVAAGMMPFDFNWVLFA